ncbi:acyl-CoA synthetase family member 4-like isoform X2 [Acanthaster planci]|uniref:Acyl-CoA synthetase family member 4-like isoform X2 n=1 Tax=Acanthaster planci TaxID=133434 RepID=A0A8B7XH36_ACAPL|nr:acyl-CoA synthetase family member 4-like isoform X2 [Acanthaster planci]
MMHIQQMTGLFQVESASNWSSCQPIRNLTLWPSHLLSISPLSCILLERLAGPRFESFDISPEDVIFVASALTFDPSIVTIFLALSKGACLVLVPDSIKMIPRTLLDVLLRNQVSVLQATPTLVGRFGTDQVRQNLLASTSSIRVLAFGGEICPTVAQINHMRAADNITKFYNLYGITEVSSWASCYHIDTQCDMEDYHRSIPLGEPLLETTLEVRNEDGQTITDGEGQLFIGSNTRVCLLNDETWPVPVGDERGVMRSTEDRVRITDRGLIFVGRHSDHIKRNGIRVSLMQVKQRIEALPVIESCEILQTSQGKLLLFCIPGLLVQLSNQSLSIGDEDSLQSLLKDVLPSHCLPDTIYFLERFPLTLHGKVDHRALLRHATEMGRPKREVQDPPTKEGMLRKDLVILWKKAAPSSVDPEDSSSFILHGSGDSFQAVQLVDAIELWTGRPMPHLLDIILHKTFRHVLKHIQSCSVATTEGQLEKPSKRRKTSLQNSIKDTSAAENKFKINSERPELLENNQLQILAVDSESEAFFPKAAEKYCVSSHEMPDTIGVQEVTKNSTEDPPNATDFIVLRRCSQLVIGRQRKEFGASFVPKIQSDGSGRLVARDNPMSNFHLEKSVNLQLRWRYDTGKCVDASPLLVKTSWSETIIYIGSHSCKFAAISMETGKALWVTQLGDRVESSACLSTCGTKVIVGCYDNQLYILDAASGTVCWKFQTNGPIKSSPVPDDRSSMVYVGSHDQHLYALDIDEQSCKWHVHCGGGSVFSSPVVHYPSATVYVTTLSGLLLAVNKDTGAKTWSYSCSKPVFSSPMVSQDGIVFGCVDGHLYCVSHSGKELWRFSTDASIFSSPCVSSVTQSPVTLKVTHQAIRPSTVDSCVVFGSHDHHVYCLSLKTGQLLWKHRMPAAVYASPFIFHSQRLSHLALHDSCSRCKALFKDEGHTKRTVKSIPKLFCNSQTELHSSGDLLDDSLTLHVPCEYGKHCVKSDLCKNPNKNHGCKGNQFVATCSTEGSLVILDLKSGEVIASCRLPGEVFSSPVAHWDCVIVGCRDDNVYCVEIVPV